MQQREGLVKTTLDGIKSHFGSGSRLVKFLERPVDPEKEKYREFFQRKLVTLSTLLKNGRISDRGFLESAVDGRPVKTLVMLGKSGIPEIRTIERTPDHKLIIREQENDDFPEVIVTVGLSEDGELKADEVLLRRNGQEVGKDSNRILSKKEFGDANIQELREIVPYDFNRTVVSS